jgi:hypothetical protein
MYYAVSRFALYHLHDPKFGRRLYEGQAIRSRGLLAERVQFLPNLFGVACVTLHDNAELGAKGLV